MTDIISNIITDKQDIKNQLGTIPDALPLVKRFNRTASIRRLFSKQFFTELGTSFALGSATNGILGTTTLGDRRVDIDSRVFPYKNIVEEDFVDDTFIDNVLSTGTINIPSEEYTVDGAELLQSKTVCKIGLPISNVKVTSLNYTGDAPVIEVSNDNGITFFTTTLGTLYNFSASNETDSLQYRVTTTGNTVLSAPIKIQVNKG
jgi:hypothetical protein